MLSRSIKSVQSIRNYLSGVKLLHILHDFPFPSDSLEIKLLLKGISRLNPHCPKQAFSFGFYSSLYFYVHLPHTYRHLVTCYVCQIFAIPEEKHFVSCLWEY